MKAISQSVAAIAIVGGALLCCAAAAMGIIFLFRTIPYTSLIMFFVFREGGNAMCYFLLFFIASLPSPWIFWRILKETRLQFSVLSVMVGYFLGLIALIFAIPIIATPFVSPLVGFLVYGCLAWIVGSIFVLFETRGKNQNLEMSDNHTSQNKL
ncbi:hypothetical protein [uncultured Cohaesibacter sp.]|uniref:hypothetical protein n=1 Tax=uncultured Cohaesibacter sp. TaxID=1002546 RepID=UPI0029C71111|nr:hypothetical protein [uncultured Cohaesibacter sp.]